MDLSEMCSFLSFIRGYKGNHFNFILYIRVVNPKRYGEYILRQYSD